MAKKNYKYYYIYITTNNINGKKYIGLHKTDILNDNYLGSGRILIKAFKKHGYKNFSKEIIEFCNNEEELKQREIYWIDFYNANLKNNYYNYSTGGESRAGVTIRPYMRKRISKALKEYFKNNPSAVEKIRQRNIGRKQKPEELEKQRNTRKLKKSNCKSIIVYTKNNEKLIYDSLNDVVKIYGGACASIFKKGFKFHKNMLFVYKSINLSDNDAFNMINSYKKRQHVIKIEVTNLENGTVIEYDSILDFCNANNFSCSAVYSAIFKKRLFKQTFKIKKLKKE